MNKNYYENECENEWQDNDYYYENVDFIYSNTNKFRSDVDLSDANSGMPCVKY